VALDERLYLRDVCGQMISLCTAAGKAALALARKAPGAIMPGYTHLQRAQPVAFGHWCLAWVEMLLRDRRRFAQVRASLDLCPLGVAALAGSTLQLDRGSVARELGFKGVTANSLDTVSDRDYLLELAAAMSILMTHLSRLGEEVVLYCSQEFGFFGLEDSIATGSSLMPQKRNPDVAELLRAKSGRAHGLLVQLLTIMKGLPLAYNRDMQEDKEVLFSTIDHVQASLRVVPVLLDGLVPKPHLMEKACREGFLEATDAAEWLVRKGVPFRQAHEATGKAVRACQEQGITLSQLTETQWKRFHPVFTAQVKEALLLANVVNARRTPGGTALARVRAALKRAAADLRRKA
jgi:argininosuccinate lyase